MDTSKLIKLAQHRALQIGRAFVVCPEAQTCRIRSVMPLDRSGAFIVHPDGQVVAV